MLWVLLLSPLFYTTSLQKAVMYLMPTSTKTSEVFTSYGTHVIEQLKYDAPCWYSIDGDVKEASRSRHYNKQFVNV